MLTTEQCTRLRTVGYMDLAGPLSCAEMIKLCDQLAVPQTALSIDSGPVETLRIRVMPEKPIRNRPMGSRP